VSNITGMLLN